jgi:hypothetical protein
MPKLVFSTFRPSSLLPKLVGAVSDLLVGQGHSALQWQASRSARAVSWGQYCASHTVWFGNVIRSCVEGSRPTSPRTSTDGGPVRSRLTSLPRHSGQTSRFWGRRTFLTRAKSTAPARFSAKGPVRAGPPFGLHFCYAVPGGSLQGGVSKPGWAAAEGTRAK